LRSGTLAAADETRNSRAAGSALALARCLRRQRSSLRAESSGDGFTGSKARYSDALVSHRAWKSAKYHEAIMTGHSHNVECLATADSAVLGEVVISASWDCDVRVYSVATQQCLRHLTGHTNWITCMVVGQGYIVTGGLDKALCVWEYERHGAGQADAVLRHPSSVTACCWICQGIPTVVLNSFSSVERPNRS
jgi:hypothetical protein